MNRAQRSHTSPGRGGGGQNYRSNRREELVLQEQLILQKKREIEDKLRAATGDSLSTTALPNVAAATSIADDDIQDVTMIIKTEEPALQNEADEQKPTSTPEDDGPGTATLTTTVDDGAKIQQQTSNVFANDGSFMEKFRQMQEQVKKQKQVEDEAASAIVDIVKVEAERVDTNSSECTRITSSETKISLNPVIQSRLQVNDTEPTVFLDDGPTVKLESNTSEEETDVRSAIEKCAISVALGGTEAENSLKRTHEDEKAYSWLFDETNVHYKYYLQRLEELKAAIVRVKKEPVDDSEEQQPVKKQRKSRWGEVTPGTKPAPTPPTQDQTLLQYALKVFGSTDLTADQWKQLEDQRKMNVLVEMLRAKHRQNERLAQSGKVKYEYDSDEETDGGTWEHRRRQEEMEKTQAIASDLTEKAAGRHHIGDFLPPDELERFMQKWDCIKDGKTAELLQSDYEKFKLTSDNVGYKMLQKLGWSEGQGLGASTSGIADPVNSNAGGPCNAGLGLEKTAALKEGDSEFDAYRKRMMMAYRFRPNPLNNPRRDYY